MSQHGHPSEWQARQTGSGYQENLPLRATLPESLRFMSRLLPAHRRLCVLGLTIKRTQYSSREFRFDVQIAVRSTAMDKLAKVNVASDTTTSCSATSDLWASRSLAPSSPFQPNPPGVSGTGALAHNPDLPPGTSRALGVEDPNAGARPEIRSQLRWPDPRDEARPFVGSVPSSVPAQSHLYPELKPRSTPDFHMWDQESTASRDSLDLMAEPIPSRGSTGTTRSHGRGHGQRRPSNRDEFDGPHQFLDKPSPERIAAQERELPHVPTNLFVQEQDDILAQVNDRLSQCAYDFIAKYQFPIPLESDKRPVQMPQDREWTEWVYLLKRLATKRRIPARVLYNGQIKQLVTVLENSLEMRHAAKHQSRPLKDDRNVLQLISAGLQVAKILKDASTMEYLDRLYVQTEALINSRKSKPAFMV